MIIVYNSENFSRRMKDPSENLLVHPSTLRQKQLNISNVGWALVWSTLQVHQYDNCIDTANLGVPPNVLVENLSHVEPYCYRADQTSLSFHSRQAHMENTVFPYSLSVSKFWQNLLNLLRTKKLQFFWVLFHSECFLWDHFPIGRPHRLTDAQGPKIFKNSTWWLTNVE